MSPVRADIDLTDRGMRHRHFPLFLDSTRKQKVGFVSHAHSDHIARHAQAIGTASTLRLLQHRLGDVLDATVLPYRKPMQLGPLTIELFSAGHVLGSAQICITHEGQRTVYTGDLNMAPSLTVEPVEVAPCDLLVIESTFGHPRYQFPPRDQVFAELGQFVERARSWGRIPVVLGYALGKAQEAVKYLGDRGYPLVAHETIAEVCELYTACGAPLPAVRRFDGTVTPDEVLFFPPHLRRSGQLDKVGPIRTVMLTGWAMDPPERQKYRAQEMIPLSDHADFGMLVDYAQRCGAKKVLTVHGFCDELAEGLRKVGIEAEPLQKDSGQLSLF
jgi:putative mRNA 3-end processing factor